ncbi:hypothetical protein BDW02DRAFT_594923 [Decorospora gaudefroyi]|uniref:Uncharacterized protein n=1 Tax=Decorospora gaudefroyi TaxID=184978 RepID=A0A6A5KI75_9PLEO|nr:hypothetical protein BDW02DRAFT_594923 [Decorospora gaudefroyi]
MFSTTIRANRLATRLIHDAARKVTPTPKYTPPTTASHPPSPALYQHNSSQSPVPPPPPPRPQPQPTPANAAQVAWCTYRTLTAQKIYLISPHKKLFSARAKSGAVLPPTAAFSGQKEQDRPASGGFKEEKERHQAEREKNSEPKIVDEREVEEGRWVRDWLVRSNGCGR